MLVVIEMVEMVEILDGRLGKRVRYVINNLLHLVIVKYGVISLVLCISTRLRLVTILSLLVKYLVILHADPCNKSYIYHAKSRLNTPVWGSLRSPNYTEITGSFMIRCGIFLVVYSTPVVVWRSQPSTDPQGGKGSGDTSIMDLCQRNLENSFQREIYHNLLSARKEIKVARAGEWKQQLTSR